MAVCSMRLYDIATVGLKCTAIATSCVFTPGSCAVLLQPDLVPVLLVQIRQLPEPQSDHAAICRAALIKITQKLLVRSK